MLAKFVGGPRDGLVAEVEVPPRRRLRVPVDHDVAASYELVDDHGDWVVYRHIPEPVQ